MPNINVDSTPLTETLSKDYVLFNWLSNLWSRVTQGVSFCADNNNVNQSISTGSTTQLNFTNKNFDTANQFSNNQFTCLLPGHYEFSSTALLLATLSGTQTFIIELFLNGVVSAHSQCGGSLINPTVTVSKLIQCNLNDVVIVKATQTTGSTQSVVGTVSQTYFYGKRIN